MDQIFRVCITYSVYNNESIVTVSMSEVYIILYLHYGFMIRIKLLINKNIIGMFHLSTTPTNDLWRVYITQNNVVGGGHVSIRLAQLRILQKNNLQKILV